MSKSKQTLFAKASLKQVYPLYKQVRKLIIGIIKDGRLKEGETLPSEENLCKLLNVSSITIRRAMHELRYEGWIDRQQGKGTFVKKYSGKTSTAEHNHNGDKRGNNRIALILPTSKKIGLFFNRILHGVENTLTKNGYHLILKLSMQSEELEHKIINQIIKEEVDGILWIIHDYTLAPEKIDLIEDNEIPLVIVDNYVDRTKNDSVGIDMYDHFCTLTERVIKHGYRKPLFLAISHKNVTEEMNNQLNGFKDALKKNNISNNGVIISKEIKSTDDFSDVNDLVDEILRRKGQFDSIIVPSLIRGAHVYLNELWKRDKNAFKNTGVGILISDADYKENIFPFPIITVKRRDYDVGKEAAKRMISKIENKSSSRPKHILLRIKGEREINL